MGSTTLQVMIEAVENHMPETIIIDEIGTELEALAASTIAQRGVQLVGTAHGMTIDNIIKNPSLQILVGGIEVQSNSFCLHFISFMDFNIHEVALICLLNVSVMLFYIVCPSLFTWFHIVKDIYGIRYIGLQVTLSFENRV